ncbi:hypothetical protein R7P67_13435 [Vibrio sp. Vb0937]|uniref:hypothetical protein n=1 Tax=unclassified Vibrio TaxID=2614977 RepID=UPI0021CDF533|nr:MULTISPECIES: hypothetical protein [unclassified Vibrio]MDW1826024.1 hypothetical protein [Vibrio sp. Vb0937]MDW3188037.1 hypothetical protein [Vibrio sp. Vb0932]
MFIGGMMPEYALLNNVVDHMEEHGHTYKTVHLDIDEKLVQEINEVNKGKSTLEQLEKAADKCLAHEWLKHAYLGGGKYNGLQITPKGIGVARSKKRSDELKANRSFLKKTSDYIEEHKGLFVVLGFLLALATLGLKVMEF